MQGSTYLHKIWNEPFVIPCKPQQTLDFSVIHRGRMFLDGFYFNLISGYSLCRNDMPQVGNLPLEQLTLGRFEL